MGRMLAGVVAALWMATSSAAAPVRPQSAFEYSLVVEGEIDVDAAGGVRHYQLDHADAYSQDVRGMIDAAANGWRFDPVRVAGQAVPARAHMRLLLVATPASATEMHVAIRYARFDDLGVPAEERPSILRIRRPAYPDMLARAGVAATAYVLLRISHEGVVLDAIVQQVDLRTQGSPKELARWRDAVEKVTLPAAMSMRVSVPTHGAIAGKDSFVAQVPFRFEPGPTPPPAPGVWEEYLPGPAQTAPWATGSFSPAPLPEGQFRVAGEGLRLLTPLEG